MQNLVTVFGGSGFVGTQAVRYLAKAGWRVRVAVRNPNLAYKMRLLGDVGQIDVVQTNIRNQASIERALDGATASLNLVGLLRETGRQGFQAIHVMGARNVAEAARSMGVRRVVQMSAIGADANSTSKYLRTKAEGEAAVREIFPDAVVVRPSIVFGNGDSFFNKFAAMAQLSPALPLIGGGHTRFQPVFVGDLGQALARAVIDDDSAGRTFELGGPGVFSFKELLEKMLAETDQRRLLIPVPWPAARMLGSLGDVIGRLIPPPVTLDQVESLRTDNVVSGQYPGLTDLGITPTSVEAVLPTYLYTYRKGGQYADQDAREMEAGRA
ncbi:MAG: complex I NDUFA9 subunit family protein [Alphaproteobacteria bacterium]|nr:complex I NDUFA9 subunit family protein [Alphaproteobacteria bacterium]MBU1517064.1 complex I NDUFA9 subunit family protein [Alphaproteobacteria bacterium]MBU2093683.1 complex I NDUFA9 subunit family protein [Alphaproteobacteria bacterium]MBU2153995.1 complex I NDUFA9 subunit family protein [Alphaproteobacteria bacterium]MBU2308717.1 complex I NDUFA9 subunit family protein [Alphaproteobacteria bacterium]